MVGDGDVVALDALEEVIAGVLFRDRIGEGADVSEEGADVVMVRAAGALTVASQSHLLLQAEGETLDAWIIDRVGCDRARVVGRVRGGTLTVQRTSGVRGFGVDTGGRSCVMSVELVRCCGPSAEERPSRVQRAAFGVGSRRRERLGSGCELSRGASR